MLFKTFKICLLLGLLRGTVGERKWDYEPVSIETYSTDESKLKVESKIDRLKRGESFNLLIQSPQVEASAYRSNSGAENDYKVLPWSIPKQPYYEYLNTYYKDVLINNLGHCSNLPQFEGKFQPPWPKDNYLVDKCVIDGEGLPEVVPLGFYKIIFIISGPDQPEWGFTVVLKVTAKLF
ncbi:uncharacterized protein LOC117193043 [Drosophila miranda]|uniref:uncharacterized protein LOC117193043 n=1 Tax=Drosophila miranda TaxID=7229 RepID=UPI00143F8EB7|nr:uncharacterized protein LOC117193043 [Drosophila miranda]